MRFRFGRCGSGSGRLLGVLAVLAAALCCLLPLLALSGALGVLAGAVERRPWVAAVGLALVGLAAVGLRARLRARRG